MKNDRQLDAEMEQCPDDDACRQSHHSEMRQDKEYSDEDPYIIKDRRESVYEKAPEKLGDTSKHVGESEEDR